MGDYPDYRGNIDLATQSLAEIINRPKYGKAERCFFDIDAKPNQVQTIASAFGRGMLYNYGIWIDYTSSQAYSEVQLFVDDEQITGLTIVDGLRTNLSQPGAFPIIVTVYDDLNHLYRILGTVPITFETSCVLKYYEKHVTTPPLIGEMIFALV